VNTKSKVVGAALLAALGLAAGMAKHFEGDYRTPYRDPVGILTVCEGHTGRDIVPGRVYSTAECAEFKRKDLLIAADTVERCITGPLTVGQRAALIDFAFNVGPGGAGVKDGLCTLKSGKTPTIRRLFNEGRAREACEQFPLWNLQKLPGLTKRRAAERKLCLS
jgi:lysozyme